MDESRSHIPAPETWISCGEKTLSCAMNGVPKNSQGHGIQAVPDGARFGETRGHKDNFGLPSQ